MSELMFERVSGNGGDIEVITLHRPQALNALSLAMVEGLQKRLNACASDETIKAVVLQSKTDKVFCAGGDVRFLYDSGRNDRAAALDFFWQEYRLNCFIHQFQKPYISLLDGITMGGGVGISLHGNTPVATENFSFAMPETGIGFFPDVGGGYLLSRDNSAVGRYLGLTGARINRADCMAAGLITHALDSHQQNDFLSMLQETNFGSAPLQTVNDCLAEFSVGAQAGRLEEHADDIPACFSKSDVGEIIGALNDCDSEWAQKTLKCLQRKSPTSLKVTCEQLRRASSLSMTECMQMEYRMVNHFLIQADFYEGVRALLIDKDKQPKWQPATLEAVATESVDMYFSPAEHELEID